MSEPAAAPRGPRHVAVIGAGIVGVATALYLQRDGHRVTLIDRLGPGEGTSKGNAAVIAVESCVPVATPGIVKRVPGMLLDPLGFALENFDALGQWRAADEGRPLDAARLVVARGSRWAASSCASW